jgi:hypothetical protein
LPNAAWSLHLDGDGLTSLPPPFNLPKDKVNQAIDSLLFLRFVVIILFHRK